MASVVLALVALAHAKQLPTQCADDTMTSWMRNSDGKNPCELVQDVMRVCDSSYELGFLPRSYSCDNAPGSSRAPCCCGSPTFALMSACWSCQYNITFDVVTTTFTGFEKDCQTLPDPITSYDSNVESSIRALSPPGWALVEPLAGKWDMGGAWKNATPYPTAAPPVPTGYPLQVKSTGISKGALAGAIVGAILGSKILFMAIGYVFYRWWRKQPGHQRPGDDDDEKGYAHRVLGEPRHSLRGRIPGRTRRGSRAHVDLDEDSASPRSSRWLGVPSYLHPTSFHSHSSQTESIPGRPAADPQQQHEPAEGGVTPFETRRSNVESEKARARRQSLRVTNDPQAQSGGSGVAVENESVVPRPQPALLAHALSSSPGSPPAHSSPRLPTVPSRTHSHAHSVGSSSGRYQEDDAGVSLVIEHEDGAEPGSNEVRCVPPAYVDYRSGYSRADKMPRFERRESDRAVSGGSASGNGTSESATYVGSAGPTRAPSVKEEKEAEVRDAPGDDAATSEDAPREDTTDASRKDATEGLPADEVRDRTVSADSEGASTIKPGSTHGEGASGPLERASTTDLATLTATNTAANRSAGPGSPSSTRPTPTTHSSAPADVTLVEPENPPSPPPIPPAESAWSWGRTLGMFGIGLPPATPAKD